MKKLLAIILVLFMGCETAINQETVSYEGEQILVGKVDWNGLTGASYSDWFMSGYKSYQPDTTALSGVVLDNIEIVLFLGTWCSDSQTQVPQFYKILDFLHYDLNKLTTVSLERQEDRKLVSPQHEEENWDICFVPTIIFLRNGQELDRIIEYPERTLEKDIARITIAQ